MTLTATSATTIAVERAAFGDLDAADTIVTTVESRRVGGLYVGVAALAVAAFGIALGVFHLNLADTSLLDADVAGRLGLTVESLVGYLALPLWFAVATAVVPRHIGASMAALPRIQAFAPWGLLVGLALILGGTLAGDGPATVRVFSRIASGADWTGTKADDLMIAGLLAIVISTVAAAANVFATVLTKRRPGLALTDVTPFTWSMLITSVLTLISYGVAAGALFVVYLDSHYAGTVFDQPSSDRVWGSMVWTLGRPDALLALIPAAGFATTLFARRGSLAAGPVARGLLTTAGVATLLVWTSGTRLLSATDAPAAPFSRSAVLLIVPALGLLGLVWVGSIRGGIKAGVGLLGAVVLLALGGLALIFGALVSFTSLGEYADAPVVFQQGFAYLLLIGLPVAVAVVAVQDHADAWGRRANPVLTAVSGLLALGGAALLGAGPMLGAFADQAEAAADRVGAVGAFVLAGAVAVAVLNLFVSNVLGKGAPAPSDAAVSGGVD